VHLQKWYLFFSVYLRIGYSSFSLGEEQSFREIRLVEQEGDWRIAERSLQARSR